MVLIRLKSIGRGRVRLVEEPYIVEGVEEVEVAYTVEWASPAPKGFTNHRIRIRVTTSDDAM
jgi:hypothetical protein